MFLKQSCNKSAGKTQLSLVQEYRQDGKEEIIYANKALFRMFQCENRAEFNALTGNTFKGMVRPDDLEAMEESIREQISNSKHDLDYVEYHIVRKDGAARRMADQTCQAFRPLPCPPMRLKAIRGSP